MGKSPATPPVVKAPTVQDKAVQEANKDALQRRKNAKGYQSTILSDSMNASRKETYGS